MKKGIYVRLWDKVFILQKSTLSPTLSITFKTTGSGLFLRQQMPDLLRFWWWVKITKTLMIRKKNVNIITKMWLAFSRLCSFEEDIERNKNNRRSLFLKTTEAVFQRCSVKKVSLKTSQNLLKKEALAHVFPCEFLRNF